jgi:hypothetical protein
MQGQTGKQEVWICVQMFARKLGKIRPRRRKECSIQKILNRFVVHIGTRNSMVKNLFRTLTLMTLEFGGSETLRMSR